MGWERKRGKLARAESPPARRDRHQHSSPPGGPRRRADGRALRRHARRRHAAAARRGARRLVGTMAHPLNRPRFDRDAGRVVRGLRHAAAARSRRRCRPDGEGSLFQRIFSGPAGSTRTLRRLRRLPGPVRRGLFTGKGIYDVDAFERGARGRVPENTLLSHDLFEGLFARAGLVTDVELFEEFPSHYLVAAARQHRWARGDWQLLPWILGRAPTRRAGAAGSASRCIGRWKMLDNLRRTLSPPLAFARARGGLDAAVAARRSCGPRSSCSTIAAAGATARARGHRCRAGAGISKRSHLRAVAADSPSPPRRSRSASHSSPTRPG